MNISAGPIQQLPFNQPTTNEYVLRRTLYRSGEMLRCLWTAHPQLVQQLTSEQLEIMSQACLNPSGEKSLFRDTDPHDLGQALAIAKKVGLTDVAQATHTRQPLQYFGLKCDGSIRNLTVKDQAQYQV